MCEKDLLRLFLIRTHGSTEDGLEIGEVVGWMVGDPSWSPVMERKKVRNYRLVPSLANSPSRITGYCSSYRNDKAESIPKVVNTQCNTNHSKWPAQRSPRATVLNPYKSVVIPLNAGRPERKEG